MKIKNKIFIGALFSASVVASLTIPAIVTNKNNNDNNISLNSEDKNVIPSFEQFQNIDFSTTSTKEISNILKKDASKLSKTVDKVFNDIKKDKNSFYWKKLSMHQRNEFTKNINVNVNKLVQGNFDWKKINDLKKQVSKDEYRRFTQLSASNSLVDVKEVTNFAASYNNIGDLSFDFILQRLDDYHVGISVAAGVASALSATLFGFAGVTFGATVPFAVAAGVQAGSFIGQAVELKRHTGILEAGLKESGLNRHTKFKDLKISRQNVEKVKKVITTLKQTLTNVKLIITVIGKVAKIAAFSSPISGAISLIVSAVDHIINRAIFEDIERVLDKLNEFSRSWNREVVLSKLTAPQSHSNSKPKPTHAKVVALPQSWSLNALAHRDTYLRNKSNINLRELTLLAQADIKASYPWVSHVSLNNNNYQEEHVNGGTKVTFTVDVTRSTLVSWSDKSYSRTKPLKVSLFLSNNTKFQLARRNLVQTGRGGHKTDSLAWMLAKDDTYLPEFWVSNFVWRMSQFGPGTFESNVARISKEIKKDLEHSFQNWNVEVSQVYSSNKNIYYYPDAWNYKVKFTNKENPKIQREAKGIVFTNNK